MGYGADVQPISLGRFEEPVLSLASAFRARGVGLYLVGGVVRDLLLGGPDALESADFDFTTPAVPTQIVELVEPIATSLWRQGERFGTIGARVFGLDVEITTHRGDRYRADSRRPEVEFSTEVEADLARRDFTVNAMAIDPLNPGQLIDPFDGRSDLGAKRLVTPIDPHMSFGDDPLRMIRAARFVARLGFSLEDNTERALGEMVDRIDIVAVERIRSELDKILLAGGVSRGLSLLATSGLWSRVLPEVPWTHQKGLALERAAPSLVVRLAVLLMDCDTGAALRSLRYSNSMRSDVEALVEMVRIATSGEPSEPGIRRALWRHAGRRDEWLDVLEAVKDGMGESVGKLLNLARDMDRRGALDELGVTIDGLDIQATLGCSPGKVVGRAQRFLIELQIQRGVLSEEAQRSALRSWNG